MKPVERLHLFTALRASFREGYDRDKLRSDVLAGIVVGIVAVPLSLALAIACGVPPQHGLYTAIFAGLVIGATGGSRTQVSGPTAAFVAILAPITVQHGVTGLMMATMMAGVMLVGMGLTGFGRLVQLVPYPVTTGFTAGIAVVIASLQLRDAMGLPPHAAESFGERVVHLAGAVGGANPWELGLTGLTVVTLLIVPRRLPRVPAPLIAIPLAAVSAVVLETTVDGATFVTIADRFSYVTAAGETIAGLPRALPSFALPWGDTLNYATLRALVLPATAIAILGAIESLLSAVIADGMTEHRHDPDGELVAQGLGNIVAPFFGGIAATGALARTATNIRFGGRSPIAAITHAVVVLLAVLMLPGALGYLPMAALAGLLLVVAWNMAELPHFITSLRRAPQSDALVQLVCFGLTVWFDMVVAIVTGTVLAAVLFMRRMVEVSGFEELAPDDTPLHFAADPGVLVYAVRGALFFGAAHKAVTTLSTVSSDVHTVVLDLRTVPALDQTGLVNLQSTIAGLRRRGVRLVLVGLQPQPLAAVERAGWDLENEVEHYPSLDRVNLAPKKPSASSESGIVSK